MRLQKYIELRAHGVVLQGAVANAQALMRATDQAESACVVLAAITVQSGHWQPLQMHTYKRMAVDQQYHYCTRLAAQLA